MPKQDTQQPRTLRDYMRAVRRRKWWLIISVIVCTVGALGYSYSQPKKYTATAILLIKGIPNLSSIQSVTPPTLGIHDLPTAEEVLTSVIIRNAVKAMIGTTGSVGVATAGQSDVLLVSSTSRNRNEAAIMVNAYAAAYLAYRQGEVSTAMNAAIASLQNSLSADKKLVTTLQNELNKVSPTSTAASALTTQLTSTLQAISQVDTQITDFQVAGATTKGAQIVSPAVAPTTPSSPKKARNAEEGFVLGLLLGLLLCISVDTLDDSLHSRDDIETVLGGGIPPLAFIPRVIDWKAPDAAFLVSVQEPQSAASEAYRSMRQALQFTLLDKGCKTLLVTSSVQGEGKTVTSANLAVALARAGKEILVVSADLRRPRLGEFFGLDESVGLTSVVLATTTFDEAVRPVSGVDGLWFLGTGPLPPDPAEFLAAAKVAATMAEAADRFDLVIVDCAPLLPVADPLAASQWCDAVVVVTRAGWTRRRQLRRGLELLRSANARIFGAVFNDMTDEALAYRGYGYYYYEGYGGYGGYGQPRRRRNGKGEKGETLVLAEPSIQGSSALPSTFE